MTAVVTGALAIAKGADGRQRYHYKGAHLVGVPDAEVARLVEAGLVANVEPVTPVLVEVVDVPAVENDLVVESTELKRPALVAPKTAWVDFAVAQGHPVADAEALSKADLIELLGS